MVPLAHARVGFVPAPPGLSLDLADMAEGYGAQTMQRTTRSNDSAMLDRRYAIVPYAAIIRRPRRRIAQ
jgi:hypothetical protein